MQFNVLRQANFRHIFCISNHDMRFQRTIRQELVIEGRGLHTGSHAIVRLKPAPRDSGIMFYRSDKGAFIKADVNSVCDTAFATSLGSNGSRIKTVEHLLAALAGLGIDNVLIEVNGPEIPILDGSSAQFVRDILDAGIANQSAKRPYLKVIRPVCFKEGNAEITVVPYEGRRLTYQIYFDHRLLGHQKLSMDLYEDKFVKELAPARTFGFLKDIERLRSMGLAKGGSLDNAVILGEHDVMNSTGLRFKDEFIRHKVLDFIGDLSLIGFPVEGHISAVRSGHSSNFKFVKKLLSAVDCWQVMTGVERHPGFVYS